MSSSYENVKRAKLSFKGGLDPSNKIQKKKKKQHKSSTVQDSAQEDEVEQAEKANQKTDSYEHDTGIGHKPDGGSKSKHYEELFPVETKRFGYYTEKTLTREEALDVRVKQKADRYCK